METTENNILNNINENEVQEDITDRLLLDKVYIEYPDGTIELKHIGIKWDVK